MKYKADPTYGGIVDGDGESRLWDGGESRLDEPVGIGKSKWVGEAITEIDPYTPVVGVRGKRVRVGSTPGSDLTLRELYVHDRLMVS